MNWVRFEDNSFTYAILRRSYQNPLKSSHQLCISLYGDAINDKAETSVKISCSEKLDTDDWWTDVGIPRELIPHIIEMLEEVKNIPYTRKRPEGEI